MERASDRERERERECVCVCDTHTHTERERERDYAQMLVGGPHTDGPGGATGGGRGTPAGRSRDRSRVICHA